MVEWTINLGSILTASLIVLGFVANGLVNAFAVIRSNAAQSEQLKQIDMRLTHLEASEERMTQVLVEMAQSRTEINLLSKRIDDVQRHGSYRLAEILAGSRSPRNDDEG